VDKLCTKTIFRIILDYKLIINYNIDMKIFLSKILYYIGDIISLTTMQWLNGFGYSIYRICMLWSCELDTDGVIWKHIENKK
jgi:hypothetical protein